MSFISNFKKALLVTTAIASLATSLKATEPFNEEFLSTAKTLEAKHPELFRGFNDTDFVSIKTILSTKNDSEDVYIATPPEMFHRLIDRIQRHAGSDSKQLKLLLEMREHVINKDFNYIYYVTAMFRHAAFLRLADGQKCEFEEVSTELPNNFGERYFRELYSQRPMYDFMKAMNMHDEATEDDTDPNTVDWMVSEVSDELAKKKGIELRNLYFPLYEHHDVGVAYLGYMFLNRAFPLAYPEKFGQGRLHGLTMSQYGELLHDFAHGEGFQDIQNSDTFASELIKAYRSFITDETYKAKAAAQAAEKKEANDRTKTLENELETLKAQIAAFKAGNGQLPDLNAATNSTSVPAPKKKGLINKPLPFPNPRDLAPKALELTHTKDQETQKAINTLFNQATIMLSQDKLSLNDYSTLMVGLFNRAHEDYFDGNAVWQARSFADLLDAYFKENSGTIELKDEQDKSKTASTSSKEDKKDAPQISSNNPFNASYLTGKTTMSDEDILEIVARMPGSQFKNNFGIGAHQIVGGKVTHTTHFMGVELLAQSGDILKANFEKPNFRWRLNAEHDTYLVNLGSKGVPGAQPLTVPDLKRHGDNHNAAQEEATAYFDSLRKGMNAIYMRSKEIAKQIMLPSDLVKIDESLRKISNDIMELFPEQARPKITEAVTKKD